MSGKLAGKHAVVTGGGSGVGAAIAHMLANAGAHVTITGRRQQPLDEVAKSHPLITGIVADVTKRDSLKALYEKASAQHGPISITIANAGGAESTPFAGIDSDSWDATIGLNLTGVFNSFQAGLAALEGQDWGRLIAIASTAGLKGYGYVSAYCAAKHGVVGLVRALAIECAPRGITVNAICPGFTQTPLLERSLENISAVTGRSSEQAAAALKKLNPLNRFIQPEEVAATVLWLCDEHSEAMTGQAIAVAGGEI